MLVECGADPFEGVPMNLHVCVDKDKNLSLCFAGSDVAGGRGDDPGRPVHNDHLLRREIRTLDRAHRSLERCRLVRRRDDHAERPHTPSVGRNISQERLRSQTRRTPSSVRKGSTRSSVRACGTIRSARPPVATVCASTPSSPRIASTIPSTWPAKPYTSPDWSAAVVFFAITVGGSVKSIEKSRAARADSASIETSTPGARTPPTYSPSGETTSKFVEVPKSTTMHGAP